MRWGGLLPTQRHRALFGLFSACAVLVLLGVVGSPTPKKDDTLPKKIKTSPVGDRPCPDCRWSLQSDFPEVPYAQGLEHCPDAWAMDLPMFEDIGLVFCPVTGRYSVPMGRGAGKMIYFSGTFDDPTDGEPFALGGYDPGAVQLASNNYSRLI
ncbi:MAG: hypothetical protein U0169_26125, partial [Polyangiaceae bacterium]